MSIYVVHMLKTKIKNYSNEQLYKFKKTSFTTLNHSNLYNVTTGYCIRKVWIGIVYVAEIRKLKLRPMAKLA